MSESFYTYKCGHTAKYEYIKPDGAKTQSFTLVYAHGFCSDPYGRKPEEIRKWCIENGMGFSVTKSRGTAPMRQGLKKRR